MTVNHFAKAKIQFKQISDFFRKYQAFNDFWDISSRSNTCWGKLPDAAVDLYLDVVRSETEWPTYDYSIKTLATYLNFKWRDKEPSGAASIE
jgi:predicted RecB family nuclease